MSAHHCHWPGCKVEVAPRLWGCAVHWFTLPKFLRDKVWAAYVPGQEVSKMASTKYLEAASEVEDWIKANFRGTCEVCGARCQGKICAGCVSKLSEIVAGGDLFERGGAEGTEGRARNG